MSNELKEKAIKASQAMSRGSIKEVKDLMLELEAESEEVFSEVCEVIRVNGSIAGYQL